MDDNEHEIRELMLLSPREYRHYMQVRAESNILALANYKLKQELKEAQELARYGNDE
jgi:hypothetical protein